MNKPIGVDKSPRAIQQVVDDANKNKLFNQQWWKDWCGRLEDGNVSLLDKHIASDLKLEMFRKLKSDPEHGAEFREIFKKNDEGWKKNHRNEMTIGWQDERAQAHRATLAATEAEAFEKSPSISEKDLKRLHIIEELCAAIAERSRAQNFAVNIIEVVKDYLHGGLLKPKL